MLFYFTSNGRLFKQANLEPSQGAPSASVATQLDGSKAIQLVGMSLATIPSPQCSTSVTAHSPVNIALIDQSGDKTGFDSATNTAVNQIRGGMYTVEQITLNTASANAGGGPAACLWLRSCKRSKDITGLALETK